MLVAVALPCTAQTLASAATACALKASEVSAGAIVMRGCRYKFKEYLLAVNTVTYATAADAKATTKMLAGKLVPVTNDPDGAVSQEDQSDLTSPNLYYFRGATAVELRVLGAFYKDTKNKVTDARALQVKM